MHRTRFIKLVLVTCLSAVCLIFIALIGAGLQPSSEATALDECINVFENFDTSAYVQPLTWAGRSEWVPIGMEDDWYAIRMTGGDVFILYCGDMASATSTYTACLSRLEEDCPNDMIYEVCNEFLVYYHGSDNQIKQCLSTL